jgi:transcriptional regulator with PAS, ATPase and Fis domain
MNLPAWLEGFPGAITVCDHEGIILYMNERAQDAFKTEGGSALIGSNLLDCHPEPARSKLSDLLKNQQTNAYTIEKKGKKKMIYQSPWYQDGIYAGFVELSLIIPFEMPHFIRQG